MTETNRGDGENRVSSKTRNGDDVADDTASLIDDLPDQHTSTENKRETLSFRKEKDNKSHEIFFTLLCCCSRNGDDVSEETASLIDDLPDQPSSIENKRNFEFSSSVCHSNNLKKYLIDNYTDQRLYEEYPEYLNPFAQGYETNYNDHGNNNDFEQSTSFSTCSRLSTPYDDYH